MAINSTQSDNNIVVDLYITAIPDTEIGTVYSLARQAQIDATSNKELRRQRYYVWKLLEYALKQSFNLNPNRIRFYLDDKGKWGCEECYFSLSHSKNAVAVAVSHKPVGVDIESAKREVSDPLCHKILTETELEEYNAVSPKEKKRYLLQKWCAKESLFKIGNIKHFQPKQIETNTGIFSGSVTVGGYDLFYSVASSNTERLKIFTNISL